MILKRSQHSRIIQSKNIQNMIRKNIEKYNPKGAQRHWNGNQRSLKGPPAARSTPGPLGTTFPFLSLLLLLLSFSSASLRDLSRRRRPNGPQSSKSRSLNQPKWLPKSIPKSSGNRHWKHQENHENINPMEIS